MKYIVYIALAYSLSPSFAISQELQLVGTYGETYPTGFSLSGRYGFLGTYSVLDIIDLRDPVNPGLVGQWSPAQNITDIFSESSFVFITDEFGLKIIDVTLPENPLLVGSFYSSLLTYGVAITGSYAYLVNSRGLSIIDITDMTQPEFVFSFDTPGEARGISVRGSYAFVAAYDSGLCIVDISDPYNLFMVGQCDTPGAAMRVYLAGQYAFVADNSHGLQAIDIVNPATPHIVGGYDTPGFALAVTISGGYAYLTGLGLGLRMFDVSDISNPLFITGFDTTGSFSDVDVSSDFVYLAGGAGLNILRFVPNSIKGDLSPSIPQQITVDTYPNPFNSNACFKISTIIPGDVSLTVYDLLGQRVVELGHEYRLRGSYLFRWDAAGFPSGVYFGQVKCNGYSKTIKITLQK